MAESTGPVLIAGVLAAANEILLAPVAAGRAPDWGTVWRLVPAVAGLGLALAMLEKAAPQFATGLAWLLVAGVLVFPPGKGPSVVSNINRVMKF